MVRPADTHWCALEVTRTADQVLNFHNTLINKEIFSFLAFGMWLAL
jgi:hypothetical protein